MELDKLLRQNIKALKPYSSARDEFSGEAMVFLDANENPYNEPYNRYPDPLQWKLKQRISEIKQVASEKIFLGNGSDEPIDLLYRAFCEPGIDNVVSIEPTYGMYQVAADINQIEVRKTLLDEKFQFKADDLLAKVDKNTKLVFLCSPNNPTSNLLSVHEIKKTLAEFNGLVVLDEAYIDFSPESSFLPVLDNYPNLVILQTFSKAWGMAGIRLGMAFAGTQIIKVLNRIKYPYNINILTQQKALELLENETQKEAWVKTILDERIKLANALEKLTLVTMVYPTDANFVLVKTNAAREVYEKLVAKGIIVRDRSKIILCNDCLRITVGTPEENEMLLNELKELI